MTVNVIRLIIVLTTFAGVTLLFTQPDTGAKTLVFFTVQSNILLGLYHAWALIQPGQTHTRTATILRGGVTLYILITGLVYHFVLVAPGIGFSMGEGTTWTGWLQNFLLHTAAPILAAVDWLAFGAGRKDVPWLAALYWLAYPLAYMAFVLIRGAFVHEYPYFFLDLTDHSIPEVGSMCAGLTVGFFVLGLAVIALGKLFSRIGNRA